VAFPTVVLGDFNSNVLWNHLHSPGRNHTALVQACARLGLISAYHHHFGEEHGKETRATSYFQWKRSRPYHIDYCFVPGAWASHLVSVEVGSYEQWADLSDHRPVIVDFAFPEGASAKRPGDK
jgi:endonuclease/exonuclease/phosphatase family metal-dependent hydrolase